MQAGSAWFVSLRQQEFTLPWVIVDPSDDPPNSTLTLQTVEAEANRFTASEMGKVDSRKRPTPPHSVYFAKYLSFEWCLVEGGSDLMCPRRGIPEHKTAFSYCVSKSLAANYTARLSGRNQRR